MKTRMGLWAALLAGVLFSACGDNDLLKFDNLEGIKNWTPSFVAPIATAEYTVWGLVEQPEKEDANIVLKDNQIVIQYRKDSIYSFDMADEIAGIENPLFSWNMQVPGSYLPDFGFRVPAEGKTITVGEGMGSMSFSGVVVDTMEGSFTCRYTLPALSMTYKMTMRLANVYENTAAEGDEPEWTPIERTEVMGSQSVAKNGSWDFNDILIDAAATNNAVDYKVTIFIDGNQDVLRTSDFEFSFVAENVSFTRIKGKVPTREVEIPSTLVDMGIDFWDNFQGEFGFGDAKAGFIVETYGMRMPFELNLGMTAYDGENQKGFEGQPLHLSGWDGGANPTVETVNYDKDNSNINEVLSLPPREKIEFNGKVVVNPNNEMSEILSDAKAKVGVAIEIPMTLRTKELRFVDTVKVDLKDEVSDKILEAAIRVKAENGVPVELSDGELILLDENGEVKDRIQVEKFLDAPAIADDGTLTTAESSHLIPLTSDNIKHLDGTSKLVINVAASTSGEGDRIVEVKPDASIKLSLILEVKVDGENLTK